MGLLNPWYLLFLLLIPVIVILYLLKQKAEERPFSSLMLWKETFENIQAVTPWEKLRRNLLMILQILIVALLALALASPFFIWGEISHDKAILVLDTSASMNALYDDATTRFERAVAQAREYISSMGTGAQVTIVSMDQKAVLQAANLSDKAEAAKVLASLSATDIAGNPESAINMVSSLLKQEDNQDVVFFTDNAIDLSALSGGRIIDVNSVGVNGCINYVSGAIRDGKLVVMAQVSNSSPEAFVSDINLYMDDRLVAIQEAALAPGESAILYFEGLQPDGTVIKAEINEKDLLPGDNTAYALLNAQTGSRVLLVTAGNVFLEKSIPLVEGVELYKASDLIDFSTADFDLYIFDGIFPNALPEKGNCIFLNPTNELPGIVPSGQPMEHVSVFATTATPVTAHLDGLRFGVSKVTAMTPPHWAKSFFMAGQASVGYYGVYEGRTIGVVGFDLHDSDFALRTEFPIFIHNLIAQHITQGLLYERVYDTGGSLPLRTGLTDAALTVINPRGESETLPPSQGARTYHNLDYAGLYRITDHGELDIPFIVRFPVAAESRVTTTGVEPGEASAVRGGAVGAGGRELREELIAAALLISLLEWFVYLRKNVRVPGTR